jgi:N-acetyl-anhydromuramyl-L-alanine amidase AmpD
MTLQNINDIHTIVVHCSATKIGRWIEAADISAWHRAPPRNWSMIGYHRVIRLDGSVEQGRPYNRRGAHVRGNNVNTIGICMVGGLDEDGVPADTFTDQQYHALMAEIINLRTILPSLRGICGHRDFSPDLNGDGLIKPNEWIKVCPCFEVADKLELWEIKL